MRKPYVMLIMLVGILVMALPVWAAQMSVSDSDLANISGKDIITAPGGTGSNLTVTGLVGTDQCNATTCIATTSGNVAYGILDWADNHSADASNHKGANDISGATSTVQENVVATDNVVNWGAYSSMHFTAGNVTGQATQLIETHATQDIGGF